jgi:hypothetical protein
VTTPHFALYLSETGKNRKNERADGGILRRIDALRHTAKSDVPLLQTVDDVDQVFERTAKPRSSFQTTSVSSPSRR